MAYNKENLLNQEVLESLESLGEEDGEPFINQIIKMYLNEAPNNLAKIKNAIEAKDSNLLRLEAHTLKGSSENIGAKEVSALSFEIEKKGKENDLDNVEGIYAELQKCFEDTSIEFRKLINK